MPVRILLASMPRMLLDMLAEIIATEPQFSIVGALAERSDLTSVVRRTQADLVIVGQSSIEEDVDPLLVLASIYPAKLLAIMENGQDGVLHELRLHREPVAELSTAALVARIWAAVGTGLSNSH